MLNNILLFYISNIFVYIFSMPAPYVPFLDLDLLKKVFPDAIGISVISYVITLSISRIVANKHKYQVSIYFIIYQLTIVFLLS
jgi:hypothetical protein